MVKSNLLQSCWLLLSVIALIQIEGASAREPLILSSSKNEPSTIIVQANESELNELLLQGKEYVEAKDYDRALAIYERAATLDANNAQIFSGIGYLQAQKQNYQLAIAAYKKAIALEPDNAELYYALGYSFGNAGKNVRAAQAYQRAIALEPENVQNYIGLGIVQLREQQYDRA